MRGEERSALIKTATSALLPPLLWLGFLIPPAHARLIVEADDRGVMQVRVAETVYLTDLAVSVIKPGWTGELANQRAVDPAEVSIRVDGETTIYVVPLGDPFPGVLIQRIIRADDGAILEFELIPDENVEFEVVLLQGALATVEHAGRTQYYVGDDGGVGGTLPAEFDADRDVVWSGRPDWFGLERPDAGGLRAAPRYLSLQLQDDRKWDVDQFSLQFTASGGEVLARKPIPFAVTLRAEEPGSLAVQAHRTGGVSQEDDRAPAVADLQCD